MISSSFLYPFVYIFHNHHRIYNHHHNQSHRLFRKIICIISSSFLYPFVSFSFILKHACIIMVYCVNLHAFVNVVLMGHHIIVNTVVYSENCILITWLSHSHFYHTPLAIDSSTLIWNANVTFCAPRRGPSFMWPSTWLLNNHPSSVFYCLVHQFNLFKVAINFPHMQL